MFSNPCCFGSIFKSLLIYNTCRWSHIQREAAKMTSNYYNQSVEFRNNYIKWHQEHHEYRIVLAQFVEGLQYFNQQK